jgi:glycosyltransferase involved in cell wall biosynthesis
MYRVALIPPEQWIPNEKAFEKGERPDVYSIYDDMRKIHGVDIVFVDPYAFPLNPLARMHPVYRGIDLLRTLKLLFKLRSYDAVVSVFESSPTLLLLLRSLFRFKIPIGMWDIAPDEKWAIRRKIQDIVVPRIDKVMSLSSAQVAYAENRWKAGHKFSVIWQHVDTDFFTPMAAQPSGPILAIGDDHGRDWDTFIEAIAPLDVEVILKTRKDIKIPANARCKITQIKDRISFPELRALYGACSFVVIPLQQTLNVSGVGSILEAMAMGKAIVLNNNKPILDYVVHGETAEVVAVGNSNALRQAIVALKNDPERSAKLGNAGRTRAMQLYSPKAFSQRLAEEIKAMILEYKKPPNDS